MAQGTPILDRTVRDMLNKLAAHPGLPIEELTPEIGRNNLLRAAMRWFWDQYLPDHNMRKEPTASPLLATLEQLRGLPGALIITAENDVLRDEGEAYGRKLISARVEVVTTRYNATIHDFVLLNALAQAAPTRAAVMQAVAFLKEVFAQKK